MSNEIISYHNFMFPFRFDKIVETFNDKHEFYKKHSFDDRVRKAINEELKESLVNSDWGYKEFKVKNNLDYNEFVYFYDFVKDSMFNTKDFEKNATSYYFEKDSLDDDAKYIIKIKSKNEPYELNLKSISLRIFDTGVGILSFELENYDYKDIDDILKINEFGRRVYPQFLGGGFDVNASKEAFLAEYLEVNGVKDEFKKDYKSTNIELASFIYSTLGDTFTTKKDDKGKYYIQPILDDRMFVVCWYGDNEFSKNLTNENYIKNDKWYEFVFVDGNGKTIHSKNMHEKLIKKSTYDRWMDYKYGLTLYGITRYSFVCISENNSFTREVLPLPHMKTIYFQMITLLLAQRASILRFSDEVTAISDIESDEKPSPENIANLYKNFLRFTNKLYFKEITAQEQGIELYEKAQNIMNIERDINDVRTEIGTINSYAFFEQERDEKEEMNKLSRLGYIFLPPTLLAGIYGMNIFKFNNDCVSLSLGILSIIVVSLLASLLLIKNKFFKFIKPIIIILMIGTILSSSFIIGSNKFKIEKIEILKKEIDKKCQQIANLK